MFPIYLEVLKTGSQLFRALQTLLQLFRERNKWIPAIWIPKNVVHNCQEQKMQFTTVRSKEKEYDIYLKSEKLVHSQLEHEKNVPAIWNWKKLVPSYLDPDKHCCSYLEREKCGSLLFGDQKMQFTTVRSKEKDYDIYLKSEKLVHRQQEHEKNVSQLFGSVKNWSLAISSLTKTVAAIW